MGQIKGGRERNREKKRIKKQVKERQRGNKETGIKKRMGGVCKEEGIEENGDR